ncbi:MAG: hypothetical protein IKM28_04450 [Lachnospiraceae bacterium]|nr:hypothetical protein [Lachnospiraceae bacterium]
MSEDNRSKKKLAERIEDYMKYTEKDEVREMFSQEEWEILSALQEGEQLRAVHSIGETVGEDGQRKEDKTIQVLERLDAEKEVSFRLKEATMTWINQLMQQGTVDSWIQIFTWYQLLDRKQWLHRFWEFHLLKIVLDIFMEELKAANGQIGTVSVLSIHSIEELFQRYFELVFLLRRLEYDLEEDNECMDEIKKCGFSLIFISMVLETGRIDNKEKVIRKLQQNEAKG